MQHTGIIRVFSLPGGTLSFSVLGEQEKLLGCGLLGGISAQVDTMVSWTDTVYIWLET